MALKIPIVSRAPGSASASRPIVPTVIVWHDPAHSLPNKGEAVVVAGPSSILVVGDARLILPRQCATWCLLDPPEREGFFGENGEKLADVLYWGRCSALEMSGQSG